MEDRKTRINRRWMNFCHSLKLTENIEPNFIAYLLYINWLMLMSNNDAELILKICADLICQHIKLYKKNPMDNTILRIRMMTIKEYAKTVRQTDYIKYLI